MKTFASQQTFHAVCEQYKQVVIISYCALIESMQFLDAFSWFVCSVGKELHRFWLGLNFFRSYLRNYLSRVQNCDDLLIWLKIFEIIEYTFQLTGCILLVHREPIFCIDHG